MCVGDYTNQIWLSGFNDVGVSVIGKTADEMNRLKDEDEGEFTRHIAQACGKMYDFGIRAKAETYGDNTRYVPSRSSDSPSMDAYRTCFTSAGSSTPFSASSPSTLSRRLGACSRTSRCGDKGRESSSSVCFKMFLFILASRSVTYPSVCIIPRPLDLWSPARSADAASLDTPKSSSSSVNHSPRRARSVSNMRLPSPLVPVILAVAVAGQISGLGDLSSGCQSAAAALLTGPYGGCVDAVSYHPFRCRQA